MIQRGHICGGRREEANQSAPTKSLLLVLYSTLPGIMLLKAIVRWPMKSWPMGSWSHTKKRTRVSSGMWMVNTRVSSHIGLNPVVWMGWREKKRGQRVREEREERGNGKRQQASVWQKWTERRENEDKLGRGRGRKSDRGGQSVDSSGKLECELSSHE